jgi:hypothetical protein
MAEKPKVRAPKQRTSQRRAEDEAKRRQLMMLGGGALVVLLAIVGVGVLLGVGAGDPSPSEVRQKLVAAGCTMRTVDAKPGDHTLAADDTSKEWNTDPPTSGPHFGFDANQNLGTAIWGAYDEPIQLARVVHNLEHGGIYVFYGDKVKQPVVAQLREFYDDHENGTIVAPYAKLGNQIALGAWNLYDDGSEKAYLAKCKRFDEDAYSTFFSAFQFKGPERFPSDSLLPGQN